MPAMTGDHPDERPPEHPGEPEKPAPAKPAAARADKGPVRAAHGYVSEVRWQGGQGRQPYSNQGAQEAPPPNQGDEFEGGNRSAHSGVTLEQMRQVKGKP